MPSYVIHSVAGTKMLDKLNLTEEQKKMFIIGNLLPDYVSVNLDPNLNEQERRQETQKFKVKTHFRTRVGTNLEYPDMTKVITQYGEKAKSNLATLACIFHLYTDFYFFTKTLPEAVTFLDSNMQPTEYRNETAYVRINKTGQVVDKQTFWSKFSDIGLYTDYNRLNSYLIREYGLEYLDLNELRDFARNNAIDPEMEELDPKGTQTVINNLEKFFVNAKSDAGELKIFSQEKIDSFFNEVVDSFIFYFGDYLTKFTEELERDRTR